MKAAVLKSLNGTFDSKISRLTHPKLARYLSRSRPPGYAIRTFIWPPRTNSAFGCPPCSAARLAGIVKEIGPEVRDFAVGDHFVGSQILTLRMRFTVFVPCFGKCWRSGDCI
jgi:S-(hydroxymethyl)glutathione dehydrogenase / alcohol dehydrogenase